MQDLENVGVGYAVEGAVAQDGLDLGAFFRSAALERMDHGHRDFAFAQIAGDGLAEHIFRGGEVEHIVDDLEGHAEVASVLAERGFLLGSGAAEDGAQAHADGEQACRLAVDEVEMLVERDELAELFHLQQFAFDHLLREFDEGVEDAEIALLHRDLEGLHVEPVAGQHALRIAPLRVGGGTAAAGLGFVDDVVVDQRGGVDDLDDRAQSDGALALVVEELGGEQQAARGGCACRRRARRYSPISVMA